jgi:hypothetical protein
VKIAVNTAMSPVAMTNWPSGSPNQLPASDSAVLDVYAPRTRSSGATP